jgi:hypothetical protein
VTQTRGAWIVVAMLWAAIAACSSVEKRCEGDLAEVGAGCPPTFDGTTESIPACPGDRILGQRAYACGDLIMLDFRMAVTDHECIYEASSHQLVGAVNLTDTAAYCDQTSNGLLAGRTPMIAIWTRSRKRIAHRRLSNFASASATKPSRR